MSPIPVSEFAELAFDLRNRKENPRGAHASGDADGSAPARADQPAPIMGLGRSLSPQTPAGLGPELSPAVPASCWRCAATEAEQPSGLDRCHCGHVPVIHPDGFTRGLCPPCDANRCDTSMGMESGCPVMGRPQHRFWIAADNDGDLAVWSGDPQGDCDPELFRFELGDTPAADALWALIVTAVEDQT